MTEKCGILNDEAITALALKGAISSSLPPAAGQIQPASLDLRLGKRVYRIRASFLPAPGVPVEKRLAEMKLHEFSLEGGAVLETGCVYLVELCESLALPPEISGTANPKSSTGRLDVFTRVLADGTPRFDSVPAGYHGRLYAEVSPRTFPVLVRSGSRLSQVRFRIGNALLSEAELEELHAREPVVDGVADIADGLGFSVDLRGEESGGLIGYRAKRHAGLVDIDLRGAYAIEDFWEPILARADGTLILDPDEFYILASKEAVQIAPDCAAEMRPFDPLVGEFRVHYAGFFDPGFGYAGAGGLGSRAVLEVRSREVPFSLEHGQTVGRLVFERMQARPRCLYGAANHYQSQTIGKGLALGKQFHQRRVARMAS
ncbi:dCTP deaminase [Bradyrhizobium sp. USDA 4341]